MIPAPLIMARTRGMLIAPLALVTALATLHAAPLGAGAVAKTVLVTVLDEAGNPLRNLRPPDFIIHEDGTQREIIDAELSTEPVFVALLVDTARPVPGVIFPTQDLRRGLRTFTRRILDGTDGSQVQIVDVAMAGSIVVPYTADERTLNAWINPLVANERASGVLLEALVETSRQLMSKPSPRRAIVSITFDAPEGSALTPQAVADVVVKSGAAYWPVSIRGIGRSAPPVPLREALFSTLPNPTGGLWVTALSSIALEKILGRVAVSLTSQYEVTYARPNGISVKEIQATARRGTKVLRASWIR
jgi:hypothetical protein